MSYLLAKFASYQESVVTKPSEAASFRVTGSAKNNNEKTTIIKLLSAFSTFNRRLSQLCKIFKQLR